MENPFVDVPAIEVPAGEIANDIDVEVEVKKKPGKRGRKPSNWIPPPPEFETLSFSPPPSSLKGKEPESPKKQVSFEKLSSTDDIWNAFDEMDDEESGSSSNTDVEKKCSACSSNSFKVIDGFLVCSDCGLQNGQDIEANSEWRYYGADDNKSADPTRCGNAIDPLLPQTSMATYIGGRKNSSLTKMHRWHCSVPYKEKTLKHNFDQLRIHASNLKLNQCVTQDSFSFYKAYSEKHTTRGKNHLGVFAVCIHCSCRRNDVKLTAKEICDGMGITLSTMKESYKNFMRIMFGTPFLDSIEPTTIPDFIIRYCRKLNLSKTYIDTCIYISKIVDKFKILTAHTPPSCAIGIIYFTYDLFTELFPEQNKEVITKNNLSKQCDSTSEVTIIKIFKKINNHRAMITQNLQTYLQESVDKTI